MVIKLVGTPNGLFYMRAYRKSVDGLAEQLTTKPKHCLGNHKEDKICFIHSWPLYLVQWLL